MKLSGIKSSTMRAIVHAKNEAANKAPKTPDDGALLAENHKPSECDDGSFLCSGCGTTRFSPLAYARHLQGGSPGDSHEGVYVTGYGDPWISRQQETIKARAGVGEDSPEFRERMLKAYHDRPKGPRQPGVAEGTSQSAFFD